MVRPVQFQQLSDWLARCRRPLLVTHRRPDGDALGALAGLGAALRQGGLVPQVVLFEPWPARYELLEAGTSWELWDQAREALTAACDALVILDTCSLAQLEPLGAYLSRAPRTLVIDHHLTRDGLAGRAGDLRVLDETAAATCLILAEWVQAAGLSCGPAMATALLAGIATDCGWFRFANTDARALRVAAELAARGAVPGAIHRALYQQERPERLRLTARMLAGLRLHADGRLAVMGLRRADLAASGADPSMTEDLVNQAMCLGCAEAALLFTEEQDGLVRVSFRSKQELDVSALAARFGGGGHARAAGARLRGRWEEVVPRVVAAAAAALGAAGDGRRPGALEP